MRTFTKRTVVVLAAGTLALASLGVLATQPTSSGAWGNDMSRSMDSRYDHRDGHMSGSNWFGKWLDWGSNHNMMDADCCHDNCPHDMNWHDNRGRNNTTRPFDQNHRYGRGTY